MSLNREDKADLIREVSGVLAKAQTVVIAEYRGISVEAMTTLRAKAREQDVYLRVIKNKLFQRATKGTSFESLVGHLNGPLIYSVSTDAVAAARVVYDFAKKNEKMIIRAGICAGKFMDESAVATLAVIPTKEILLSRLLGVLQAPIASFARLLAAIKEKKQAESPMEVA